MNGSIRQITTGGLPARQQLDYFVSQLGNAYSGIVPTVTTAPAFNAELFSFTGDDVIFSRMRAPGHTAVRTRRAIRQDGDESLFLNVSTGTAHIGLDSGLKFKVAPNVPVLLDNRSPFTLYFDSNPRLGLYTLKLPPSSRDALRTSAADPLTTGIARNQSAESHRLKTLFQVLIAEFEDHHFESVGPLGNAVSAVLSSVLATEHSEVSPESSMGRLELWQTLIRKRLPDPTLTTSTFARSLGLSPRTIQLEFARNNETFRGWVLQERLELAASRLNSEASHQQTVEHVAQLCGFTDISYFHHEFKKRFDTTPNAMRCVTPRAK